MGQFSQFHGILLLRVHFNMCVFCVFSHVWGPGQERVSLSNSGEFDFPVRVGYDSWWMHSGSFAGLWNARFFAQFNISNIPSARSQRHE